MIQNNLIMFYKKNMALPKKKSKTTNTKFPKQMNQKVDLKLIERSAQTFIDSILTGSLYQELNPKKVSSKITKI